MAILRENCATMEVDKYIKEGKKLIDSHFKDYDSTPNGQMSAIIELAKMVQKETLHPHDELEELIESIEDVSKHIAGAAENLAINLGG